MSVRKLLNEEAMATNFLKLTKGTSGCCGNDLQVCKHEFDLDPAGVTAVTANVLKKDGTIELMTEAFAAVTAPRDIRRALAAAFAKWGYDPYYDYDNYNTFKVTDDKLCVIGDLDLVSIESNGTQATTKNCTQGRVCEFDTIVTFDVEVGLLAKDAQSAGTAIGTNVGFPAGNTAAVQAAFEAAITGEVLVSKGVEVVEQTALGVYAVKFFVCEYDSLFLNGAAISPCRCYADFTSA